MAREMISGKDLEKVSGGSIMFNEDNTTCGRNCTNQYKVKDYEGVINYIGQNCMRMSERQMLNDLENAGLLERL